MKKIMNQLTIVALLLFTSVLFTQCRSTEDATLRPDETEITQPCSGAEYFTDEEYFRANAMGTSRNQSQSRRMAMSNARADLAGSISVLVSGTVDNYYQQMGVDDGSAYAERYEGLFREVVNERLDGIRTICERVTVTDSGQYRTYVAIELTGNEIMDAADQRISSDERLRLDYDYERFKETFNEEIQQVRDEKGF